MSTAQARSTAAGVVDVAQSLFEFVRTEAGEPYAVPRFGGARRAVGMSDVARDVTRYLYGQGRELPSKDAVAAGMTVVASLADDAPLAEVALRMAHLDGLSYLDLGTADGAYVEIRPSGWIVRTDAAPVLFRRTATTNPLPVPTRGGNRAELARLLALSTDDPRWRLMYGWLVAQFLPDSARPFLYLLGSQGSGKTTRGLLLANMLEPQDEMGGVLKRSERENNPVAKASFLLTADNMTKLSEDVSNWLCSLVTGLRVVERRLFTNDDTVAYSLKRSGIFTGKILPAGLEADAQERILTVEFGRMTAGIRSDVDLLAEFRALHASLLGALLDDVSRTLRELPDITPADIERYRFVDYGRVQVALDRVIGPGHLSAVIDESTTALADRAWESPDLLAVMRVAAFHGGRWSGTAGDLLDDMAAYQSKDSGAWWPRTATQLSTRLRNQQHTMASVGLDIEFGQRTRRARPLALVLDPSLVDELRRPASIAEIEAGPALKPYDIFRTATTTGVRNGR